MRKQWDINVLYDCLDTTNYQRLKTTTTTRAHTQIQREWGGDMQIYLSLAYIERANIKRLESCESRWKNIMDFISDGHRPRVK